MKENDTENGMKLVTRVRCKRCGGLPMETGLVGQRECRHSLSAWTEVPEGVLFVWEEEAC
jgi:hypothetical protein